MLKILVISDSHRDISLFTKLYLTHQDYDFFLHCGDSEVEPDYLYPFISVKGNCDFNTYYPPNRDINTPYGRIHIEHGNYRHDEKYILEQDAFIFLFGHTHVKYQKQFDKAHYAFNPGSLTRPRDDVRGSYLELIVDENGVYAQFKYTDEL